MATAKKAAETTVIEVKAPNFQTLAFNIQGLTPYVQLRMSEKAINTMRAKHELGDQPAKKRMKEARLFDDEFQQCLYRATQPDGTVRHGIPAAAFRNSMIAACRVTGLTMTHAKLLVFVEADGFDDLDQMGLVFLDSQPHMRIDHVRNATGVADLRVRACWNPGWRATVRVSFDADYLKATDVANLLARAGFQVGVGEGRPSSKSSNGLDWGKFRLDGEYVPAG